MSEDKVAKTSKEVKLEEQKEAEIVADIEEAIKGPVEEVALPVEAVEATEVAEAVVAPKEEAKAPLIGREAGTSAQAGGGQRGDRRQQGGGRSHNRPPRPERTPSEFEEKMVSIDRVTRVVKGGRRMRFRALVVIGDKKGRVGYGLGKGNEVARASAKAINAAKKNLINVDIAGGTIPHDTWGKSRGSQVLLKAAKKGRGIIAGGGVRVVVELAGYSDIVAKSFGSSNKINNVNATFEALKSLRERPGKRITKEQPQAPTEASEKDKKTEEPKSKKEEKQD